MESVKQKRGHLKTRVTNLKNFLSNTLPTRLPENYDVSQAIPQVIRFEIENRVAKVSEIANEFYALQDSIEESSEGASLDDALKYREEFESEFFSTIAQAQQIITRGQLTTPASNQNIHVQHQQAGTSRSHQAPLSTSFPGIKLPTIELTKFNGDIESWLAFRDTFQSLIHSNNSLGNVQKFHYLKASVKDKAEEIIKSIEISDANYSIAWSALCERYDNPTQLIHNHIKALYNIKPIVKESSTQLLTIIDDVTRHLRALKILNEPTEHWDSIIVYHISTKLDSVSSREWEKQKSSLQAKPQLADLIKFLKDRALILQNIDSQLKSDSKENKITKPITGKSKSFHSQKAECVVCKGEHHIQNCDAFLKLSPYERTNKVKAAKVCINCLRKGHMMKDCFASSCKRCDAKHNTLLHFDKPENSDSSKVTKSMCISSQNDVNVILATVLVIAKGSQESIQVRATLDSCSQSNFISSNLCEKLGLEKIPVNHYLDTLNCKGSQIKNMCVVNLSSIRNNFEFQTNCLVIDEIERSMPSKPIDTRYLKIPIHLPLADPLFHRPGKIDILIGGEWFWKLLCEGQITISNQGLTLQKTKFGWIVGGPMLPHIPKVVRCNLSKVNSSKISEQLKKFWELESINNETSMNSEEISCEQHYDDNFKRDDNGRFIVSIPFKKDPKLLGESRDIAANRLLALEKRFSKNKEFKANYHAFMGEYEELGHMTRIKDISHKHPTFYMPHHGVLRPNSTSTKLRVVFDGSVKSDSGISLNDCQMVGPVIQDDLFSILIRFRKWKYVVCADIQKMYRQILVSHNDRSLQRILWRTNPSSKMETYELNTLTYGTSSASYLAIRSLTQLAKECESTAPHIAQIIRSDFYVDDLLTGFNEVEEAKTIIQDLNRIMLSGCLPLAKWASNKSSIIYPLLEKNNETSIVSIGKNDVHKTLGLSWQINDDCLIFSIDLPKHSKVNKRIILSETSRIFDPLGILSPCTIIAKIMLQRLWLEKADWDEPLSSDLQSQWINYRDQLIQLNHVKIPRHSICNSPIDIQIHGFSDASKEAYGGCIYLRSRNAAGLIQTSLLCAKPRVAPLKAETIPRLELCGALVVANLASKVSKSLHYNIENIFLWTDSTIVLSWIQSQSRTLPVFISNRISQIQQSCPNAQWKHISTDQNPADLLSRGVAPTKIASSEIWWHGPKFLKDHESKWPNTDSQISKISISACNIGTNAQLAPYIIEFISQYSKLHKLLRVASYCFRVARKHRRPNIYVSADEADKTLLKLIKLVQEIDFASEIDILKSGKCIKKGRLASLNPFLDNEVILRVGGRMKNANFNPDKKFPMLLSSKNHLTRLIFEQEHLNLMHAGPQLLLYHTRERFWTLGGRNLAKNVVRKCITCFKCNPKIAQAQMGNLPRDRVIPSPPFNSTGVDYAGPFHIKDKKGRGSRTTKCYICLFVCLSTRALHLEIVSDLSTDSFIAAVRRFVARRGKPQHIYSDNGTTFVGANNELKELGSFIQREFDTLNIKFGEIGIQWHFIPAYSPHQGGLWEAGVRCTKHHLRRVAGNASLTFEEMYTLAAQIEAILNSRPLTPLSDDPNDYTPITPAHLLIGRRYTSIADPSLTDIKESRLSRWQYVQQLQQHFWARWSKEYISELQGRVKWKHPYPATPINTLVLIKEDNLPSTYWKLGRIVQLHPGADQIARVATIQTEKGQIKRALVKLCPLPLDYHSN